MKDAAQRVGPIPIGEGMALGIRNVEVEALISGLAMEQARNVMSDGQLCEAMKISLPKLLNTYANMQNDATGRSKKDCREFLHQKLIDAGAVTVTVQRRLEEIILPTEEQPDGNSGSESTGQGAVNP